jgi:hypothetical protein
MQAAATAAAAEEEEDEGVLSLCWFYRVFTAVFYGYPQACGLGCGCIVRPKWC